VPPALPQIAHALDQNAIAGPQADHAAGVGDRVLAWLQQNLRQLPSGKELLHPVATYGHKAGEAVVAVFFTHAATWYCVSERDSIINLLTALAPESKRDRARETYLAIDRRLGAYTRLRFLMVFAVGAVLSAGFYLIGLNHWLLVGAFIGLIEIVPSLHGNRSSPTRPACTAAAAAIASAHATGGGTDGVFVPPGLTFVRTQHGPATTSIPTDSSRRMNFANVLSQTDPSAMRAQTLRGTSPFSAKKSRIVLWPRTVRMGKEALACHARVRSDLGPWRRSRHP
jgi:AI-2E family transporter